MGRSELLGFMPFTMGTASSQLVDAQDNAKSAQDISIRGPDTQRSSRSPSSPSHLPPNALPTPHSSVHAEPKLKKHKKSKEERRAKKKKKKRRASSTVNKASQEAIARPAPVLETQSLLSTPQNQDDLAAASQLFAESRQHQSVVDLDVDGRDVTPFAIGGSTQKRKKQKQYKSSKRHSGALADQSLDTIQADDHVEQAEPAERGHRKPGSQQPEDSPEGSRPTSSAKGLAELPTPPQSSVVKKSKKRKRQSLDSRRVEDEPSSLKELAYRANVLLAAPRLTAPSAAISEPQPKPQSRKRGRESDEGTRSHAQEPVESRPKKKPKKSREEVFEGPHDLEPTQPLETLQGSNSYSPPDEQLAQAQSESSGTDLPTSGPLIPREVDRISAVLEQFQEDSGLTQPAVTELLHNTDRNGEHTDATKALWAEIFKTLPSRGRHSVQKAVRRKWHNYEKRGKWDEQEDELLAQAYELKPNQWKAIGGIIGRMPEDCRDRWRNYLRCGESRRRDIWTEQEERRLAQVVAECLEAIRKAREQEVGGDEKNDSNQDPEALLNWATVSDKLGGSRSRLQCLYKWKKVQRRKKAEEDAVEKKPLPAANGEIKKSWRAKDGEKNWELMLPGDKYGIVCAIADSETYEEKNIPWTLILKRNPESRWTTMDRKVALEKMKGLVPKQGSLKDLTAALKRYFETKHAQELSQYYLEDKSPKSQPPKTPKALKALQAPKSVSASKPAKTSKGSSGSRKPMEFKSEEFVMDVDDDTKDT